MYDEPWGMTTYIYPAKKAILTSCSLLVLKHFTTKVHNIQHLILSELGPELKSATIVVKC